MRTYTLHSNMVLLIQLFVRNLADSRVALHSNMVLLIHDRYTYKTNYSDYFTFQYGSINTLTRFYILNMRCTLHSNMVLLILVSRLTTSYFFATLHSNMVLLILVFHKCLSHKHYSTTFCRPCHFLFFRDP